MKNLIGKRILIKTPKGCLIECTVEEMSLSGDYIRLGSREFINGTWFAKQKVKDAFVEILPDPIEKPRYFRTDALKTTTPIKTIAGIDQDREECFQNAIMKTHPGVTMAASVSMEQIFHEFQSIGGGTLANMITAFKTVLPGIYNDHEVEVVYKEYQKELAKMENMSYDVDADVEYEDYFCRALSEEIHCDLLPLTKAQLFHEFKMLGNQYTAESLQVAFEKVLPGMYDRTQIDRVFQRYQELIMIETMEGLL